MTSLKLNMGCGSDIRPGYVNVDIIPIKGINLLADFSNPSYPFKNSVFEVILLRHVLEHISDVMCVMEEIYRISKKDCLIYISVPYWNSFGSVLDPTHVSYFHQQTFDYFDPSKTLCQSKGYYTEARFSIIEINYIHISKCLGFLQKLIPIKNERGHYKIPNMVRIKGKIVKWFIELGAHYFCNIINTMEITLKTIKEE